jgi:hypothetical protein
MKTTFLLFLLLALGVRVGAQTPEAKLTFAFSQLKGNGVATFAGTLYGIDADSAKLLADQLGPLVRESGDYFGYQVVTRTPLTKRVERLVIAIYYDKFPVYMRVDLYDTPSGRIYLPASVSRDAAAILPFDVISAAGK